MAEPEFSVTGVQIGKWRRSLTRAGQVLITDGRLRLLTSRGTEIDSAPVERVHAGSTWAGHSALATMNGTRYRIDLNEDDQGTVRRFLDALRHARGTV